MILVNDRDQIEWEEGMTVARLLQKCGYTARQIHVLVNGELVRREAFDTCPVRDGDQVQVIHFLGGG